MRTAILLPLITSPVSFAASPPTSQITINSATTSGSGCPRKTVAITLSPDRTSLTLGFDEFQTYLGHGHSSPDDRDKTCQIRLNIFYPPGYTFAILDATYHGYAQLDAGVLGNLNTSYSFLGGKPDTKSGKNESTTGISLKGGEFEKGGVYTKSDEVPVGMRVRAPCGRNATLLVRTRASLEGGGGTAEGMLTGDDASFALEQVVRVGWEGCSE